MMPVRAQPHKSPASERAGRPGAPSGAKNTAAGIGVGALVAAAIATAVAFHPAAAPSLQVRIDQAPAWAVAAVGNPANRHWWVACAAYPITPAAGEMNGHPASGSAAQGNCAAVFFDFAPALHPPAVQHHGVVILRTPRGDVREGF
jgi:hypothetical protein